MQNIRRVLDDIVPEQIIDCQFEEMMFTNEMLEIYFLIDGRRSLTEIHKDLSINIPEIISNIKKMSQGGLIKIRKKKN